MVNSLRRQLQASLGGLPSTYWSLWAGQLVNRLASFVITFLGLFLVRERGFSPDTAGRVVALYGLGLLLAGPLGGTLADLIGRRATMLIGLVCGGSCVAAIGFIDNPTALATVTFLASLLGDVYRPAANAAVADLVPLKDRQRAYGLIYWAINLGWAISLSIAGFVAERSFLALFLADAITSFLCAGIIFIRVPESRPPPLSPATQQSSSSPRGMRDVLADRHFLVFLLLHLLNLLVFVQFQLAMPLDCAAHGVGPSSFSLLMAMNGLGVVILQPLTTRFVSRAKSAHMLALCALLSGLGMGMNAFQGYIAAYVVGVLLWTAAEVVGFPVASALVANMAPAALRGRYQGLFSMNWGLALSVGPFLGGTALNHLGGRTLWLGALVLSIAVTGGHLLAGPSRQQRLDKDKCEAELASARVS